MIRDIIPQKLASSQRRGAVASESEAHDRLRGRNCTSL
jgi:hypothetical protein